jgi:hypothetical protein
MVIRPSRAFLAVLFGLLIYRPFIGARFSDQSRFRRLQGQDVGRQNADHQECIDNMYASDANGDLALTEDEYLMFIAKQSDGAILGENFADLPFSLVIHFTYGACFCSIIFQTPNCCVGAAAKIDLDQENSPFIEGNLITICASVKRAIGDEVGTVSPVTTPPPVQVPTGLPTSSPTETLTTAPTFAPVVQTTSKWNSTNTLAPLSPFLSLLSYCFSFLL